MSRALAPLLAVVALAWVAMIATAPRLPTVIAAPIYGIGSLICHQRAERSFHVAGVQLPVCARCAGIYLGAAAGLFAASWTTGRRQISKTRPAIALSLAALPTIVTFLVEWGGLVDPGNVLRAASGTILGAGVAAVVVTLHYDECALRRPIASSPQRPSP